MKKTLILCIVLLAGCAGQPKRMVNPHVTDAQAKADGLACRMEARRVEASQANIIMGMLAADDQMRDCLLAKGYVPVR